MVGKVDHLHGFKEVVRAGIFQNEKGMVSARITKEEYDAAQSENLWRKTWRFPSGVSCRVHNEKKLNKSEVDEIKKMIDAIGKEG